MKYVTRQGEFFKTGSLKEALSELSDQDFVSCYRGIAINLRYIWRIEKDKLYMAEECRSFEKTVPVSRRMYKQVNQKFIDYNRKQEDYRIIMELIIAIVSICIFIALLSFSILKIWLPGYMVREMEQYQNKLLERQFEEIDNTYREMRGWRHDYKNHMQVLKIYVENRQWENARDYIVQMNEDLESIDPVIKTGNIMADAIVNSKVSLAKKKDIKLDVTAKIPKEIPMTDVEFCVVFGNIMDNAIEACEKLASKENKFIRVYIGVFKKQFYMSVSNSTDQKKRTKKYLSMKGEGHGFGLQRIDKIIHDKNGYLNRQNEPGVFATEIMLPYI